MRRLRILLGFGAVLVILIVCWMAAASVSEVKSEQTLVSDDPLTPICSLTGTITEISYDYEDELIGFTLTEDEWQYAPDTTVPIRPELPEQMAQGIRDLQATRVIEPVEGVNYGFDAGSFQAEVQTDAGEVLRFTFGGINPATSEVYVKIGDEDTLYLVDAAAAGLFDYSFLEILRIDSPPALTASDLQTLTISREGRLLELYYLEDGHENAYSTAFSWFVGKPYDTLTPADTIKAHDVFNDITNLYIYGCAAFRPDAQTLELTGLASPRATITLEYTLEGRTLQSILYVGAAAEDNRTYIQYDGSDLILLADAALVQDVIYTSGSSLMPDAVCLVEQESVTSFTVERSGTCLTFSGTDEATEPFFAMLNNMSCTAHAPDTAPGEIYAAVHMERTTHGFEEMTLTFYEYDTDTLLVGFDGRTELLISRSEVDVLLELLTSPDSHEAS